MLADQPDLRVGNQFSQGRAHLGCEPPGRVDVGWVPEEALEKNGGWGAGGSPTHRAGHGRIPVGDHLHVLHAVTAGAPGVEIAGHDDGGDAPAAAAVQPAPPTDLLLRDHSRPGPAKPSGDAGRRWAGSGQPGRDLLVLQVDEIEHGRCEHRLPGQHPGPRTVEPDQVVATGHEPAQGLLHRGPVPPGQSDRRARPEQRGQEVEGRGRTVVEAHPAHVGQVQRFVGGVELLAELGDDREELGRAAPLEAPQDHGQPDPRPVFSGQGYSPAITKVLIGVPQIGAAPVRRATLPCRSCRPESADASAFGRGGPAGRVSAPGGPASARGPQMTER